MLKDIRIGVRGLFKRPGFAALAIITLALGIGANSAIFSVVNAVLLRPLPYTEPERLVMLWETGAGNDKRSVAPGNYVDWRDQNTTFSDLAAVYFGNFNLTGDGQPERIDGATVTSNFGSLLGVQPQLGRGFQVDDDQQNQGARVALISDGLWRRRFAADSKIAGRKITIDEEPYTVLGVMPASFKFPEKSDLWVLGRDRNAVPMSLVSQFPNNDWTHERDAHFIRVVGRLKAGVSLSQAQSDIAAIARRAEEQFPKTNAGLGSNLVPLHQQVVGDVRGVLLILLGAVGFVLLIACTNVANLLLARSTQRAREIAIRLAVGASRWRVIRQLLTESLLLSLTGGLAGLLVAFWTVDLFIKLSPGDIPRLNEASVDLRLLGFTMLVSLFTGVGFGLLPALHATRTNLNQSLKDGGPKMSEGGRRLNARKVLVVTEVALAQVLLVGAGLLLISYLRLTEVNPGFNYDRVTTAKIAPSVRKYPDPKSRIAFHTTVLEHLSTLPGVESVGLVMSLPLGGSSMNRGFSVEGRPEAGPNENVTMDYQVVSAGYFKTVEIPTIRGRGFNETDNETSERVAVINQTMARRYWPNEDPVGKRIAIGDSAKETSWRTIIGIVGDVRHASLSDAPEPAAFTVYRQDLESWPRMAFVIKSNTDPASLASAVRKELATIDPEQPVYAVEPLAKLLSTSIAQRRFVMWLIASLSLVALVLAMVGVYGMISFSVSERTQEIGIRMALGARAVDILKMVLGQGMRVATVGIAIGLVSAIAFTRFLSSLLFEVGATDVRTFSIVALVLGAVALLACYVPARRATKVDPVVSLKYE